MAADADRADWNRSAGVVKPALAPHRASAARDINDVLVTTRYGKPASSSARTASGAPATGAPLRTRTPSRSSSSPRTPCSAARSDGSGPDKSGIMRSLPRRTPRMGLLDGRRALIFGVANDHSIAWGIAKAFHDEGAIVGFSSVESLIERRVRPLAESIGSTFVQACDIQDDAQIKAVMDAWHDAYGEIDILVHAVAYAKREDLDGLFVDTSRDGFATALDVSAYSLVALTREARPYLHRGSSVLTLSYYGAEK